MDPQTKTDLLNQNNVRNNCIQSKNIRFIKYSLLKFCLNESTI